MKIKVVFSAPPRLRRISRTLISSLLFISRQDSKVRVPLNSLIMIPVTGVICYRNPGRFSYQLNAIGSPACNCALVADVNNCGESDRIYYSRWAETR